MNRLDTVVEDVLRAHFDACRHRVTPFVTAHFRYPGAWDTNKRALGLDLIRAPANLMWAPFYVVDRTERFWGQDRLEDLDLYLAGEL